MPPARGDHDARRRDVSAAVWRVLATQGFGGLTLRAVAAEMGSSTGLLTHYFPNKRALVAHAIDVLHDHSEYRPRLQPPAPGLAALRTAILGILPATEGDEPDNRIWVSSWGAALADPELRAGQAARYATSRERLRVHIAAAQERGEIPDSANVDLLAAGAMSFALGLVVQTLLDPEAFPASEQVAITDEYVKTLAS
ncbi:TetR/AcrR family transcriptional regulator [Longispora albida]|uniref:TetR/AcrR family transcriptional regulator n=1 Tax=Longispora albida TaxID=203523 RepID=UPI0003A48CF4|nr:TetR/AcrR family transcriptional regulator [Longispora albida]